MLIKNKVYRLKDSEKLDSKVRGKFFVLKDITHITIYEDSGEIINDPSGDDCWYIETIDKLFPFVELNKPATCGKSLLEFKFV